MSFDKVVHMSTKSFSQYCLPIYYKQARYLYIFYFQDCHAILDSSPNDYWFMKALYALALCRRTDKWLMSAIPDFGPMLSCCGELCSTVQSCAASHSAKAWVLLLTALQSA